MNRSQRSKVTVLEDKLRNGIYKDEYERKSIKNELDALYVMNAKGAQIRSRARYVEEGEKSTAFFLGLEKHRQKDNTLKVIKYKNETYADTQGILDAVADFYDDLYKSCKPNPNGISEYIY